MVETLENLCTKNSFKCKKTYLESSCYCLFSYIYILINKREIYFLCENTEDYICLEYMDGSCCKHCRRLKKYNSLFEKIVKKKSNIWRPKKSYNKAVKFNR